MKIPRVRLKSRADSRVLNGSLWVFSNEIETVEPKVEKGAIVDIYSAIGAFLGRGFYNPNSLISARILTRKDEQINTAFFARRIQKANFFRQNLYPRDSAYRLVFGESDFLPGLIIDRFGAAFVVQSNCLGMDLLLPFVFEALQNLFPVQCVIKKNDSQLRLLEGLSTDVGVVFGQFDSSQPITQKFEGKEIQFFFDPIEVQKTGFFFDQRENRERLKLYAKDKTVLDCFSYSGGFGLYAASSGAKEVFCVDSSQAACELQRKNFAQNQLRAFIHCEDVEAFLIRQQKENRKFDIIVLDPPALAKSKKNLFAAVRKYRNLNSTALSLLNEGGIFFSSSCSHHISRSDFIGMIQEAGMRQKKIVKLLELRGAARDHPVLLSMPETDYLKCAVTTAESYV